MDNDGQPKRGSKSDAAIVLVGIIIGAISLLIAYEVSYQGAGPDDEKARILVTALIVGGMISALVLIFMGAAGYAPLGLSGQEATGFSEVRRKRP